jgi:aminoglycoside phosphotransferase (APT) family kinase protein
MLTRGDGLTFLLQHDLITPANVIEGDITISDASRRHHNLRVTQRDGGGYLLKQGVGAARAAAVAHEAAIYQSLGRSVHGFRPYLPRFVAYDVKLNILVLELVGGAENLRDYHMRRGHFSLTLARRMGRVLAALHRLMIGGQNGLPHESPMAGRAPWILSIHRPSIRVSQEYSAGNLELIRTVQSFPEYCRHLDELRSEWREDVLIHRDFRWDNCVVFGKSAMARTTRLKLVDWEVASLGDPCWDIGSVFNDYLGFWLLSIPITADTVPAQFPKLARFPLDAMQPALRAFWETYIADSGLDAAEADGWLLRAVRYCAARLVQTAFEQLQMSVRLTDNALYMLQLALNVLERPEETAQQLLGLPLHRTMSL